LSKKIYFVNHFQSHRIYCFLIPDRQGLISLLCIQREQNSSMLSTVATAGP